MTSETLHASIEALYERVSYLTVWRFLNAQGFFIGDTLRSRKLKGMGI
jgi:hypothetical protein